jgi:hypothetical protein
MSKKSSGFDPEAFYDVVLVKPGVGVGGDFLPAARRITLRGDIAEQNVDAIDPDSVREVDVDTSKETVSPSEPVSAPRK